MEARPGYGTKLAHEFRDTTAVLQAKVDILARLMEKSQNCLIYSGAGISTSSGINDYATRTNIFENTKLRSPYEAQPTFAHRSLVALHDAQFVHHWVQQNHDGLPQKAGFPQYAINEIHGAWYDPSNPVVAMNGSLRSDLFQDMLEWEEKSDLTISMGTSMCGMNSDRVFTTVARKGRKSFTNKDKKHIGGVIINRQQTQYDHLSCLRIFADIDEVMLMLLKALGMSKAAFECKTAMKQKDNFFIPNEANRRKSSEGTDDVFRVPYKADGTRHPTGAFRYLDLRAGSAVKITDGPYEGDCGEVLGKNREGHYRIQIRHSFGITKRPFESVLGSWWIEMAVSGLVHKIPIVNIKRYS